MQTAKPALLPPQGLALLLVGWQGLLPAGLAPGGQVFGGMLPLVETPQPG